MAYITEAQYKSITGETALPDGFAAVLQMAEAAIDAHTLYGYVGRDLDAIAPYAVNKLREAVAYQVQYIVSSGGIEGINDGGGDFGSVSLGKYSYSQSASGRNGSAGTVVSSLPLSKAASVNIPFLIAYARELRL